MKFSDKLLLHNKAWAADKVSFDEAYFSRLAETQQPRVLWIGCSDSRVPANEITDTEPGDIFVHRNVANLVVHTDLNLITVLQYAVDVLKVEHVIVCGHYGCGGVRAAMTQQHFGVINKWLRNIKDVYHLHRQELGAIADPARREERLVQLSVQEQVRNLMKTSIIQRAWRDRQGPWLHAWVYGLRDGILHELEAVAPGTPVDPLFAFDFDA
jgi:carbonic anhydrase